MKTNLFKGGLLGAAFSATLSFSASAQALKPLSSDSEPDRMDWSQLDAKFGAMPKMADHMTGMTTQMQGLMGQMRTMMNDQQMMKNGGMQHDMDDMQGNMAAMSSAMGKMLQTMEQMQKRNRGVSPPSR